MNHRIFQIIILFNIIAVTAVYSADYKASIGLMMPAADSGEKGVFVELVEAMARVSEKRIDIKVQPFKRSMKDVIDRRVDFHLPMLENPADETKDFLEHDYATPVLWKARFNIYTNADKPFDIRKKTEYVIETDAAHVAYIDKGFRPSYSIASSLKRVNLGWIDAFVFVDGICERVIKANNLTRIRSELFGEYDVKIVLPRGEAKKEVDRFLTQAVEKLRNSGEYSRILSKYGIVYP